MRTGEFLPVSIPDAFDGDDAGLLLCPVEGCGCSGGGISGLDRIVDDDQAERIKVSFYCAWGHSWSITFSEYHGAAVWRAEAQDSDWEGLDEGE